MKIAVSSQNKTAITEHAGHCQKFWIYEINEGKTFDKKLLELSPQQSFHNSSPNEPHPLDDVQVLISRGMGRGLVERLERKEIEAVITKETDLDKAVSELLKAKLREHGYPLVETPIKQFLCQNHPLKAEFRNLRSLKINWVDY